MATQLQDIKQFLCVSPQAPQYSKMSYQQLTVHTIGGSGIEDLSSHIDDSVPCWALLRCQAEKQSSVDEQVVAIACHKADYDESLSAQVLQLLGKVDLTLRAQHGRELPAMLDQALLCRDKAAPSTPEATIEQALSEVGNETSCINWVLMEPAKLELHRAGSGGLDELKKWLPDDKVMFGVLRFTFPRGDGIPPIVKSLFIHWIGPNVSVVRRGQWNSKLEQAASKMRTACDFAFRKTAYDVADLTITSLIEELARVTCITSSDTRQLSVDWYLEGLRTSVQVAESHPSAVSLASTGEAAAEDEQHQCNSTIPFLRESAQHAINIVREEGRQWKWVLLTMTEYSVPSSGGA